MPLHFGPRYLFVALQDLLEPIDVFFCLVEMQSKAIGQAFIGGSLGHFRKCLGQLLFGAVKVFQLVNVEIFQCFKFHSEGISNLGDDLDLFFVKQGANRPLTSICDVDSAFLLV